MEIKDNDFLENEFNYNHHIHEIFKYQKNDTLDSLVKKIKKSDNNEILLQININNIMPFYKHRGNFIYESEEEYKFWEHAVSTLFLGELKENYDINTNHDIDIEKKILTRESFQEYQQYEEVLINRNDVIEAIKDLNLEDTRLHIVVRYVNNEYIWKELVNYLEDNLPFITMIYSDGDINRFKVNVKDREEVFPTDIYKYKIFDKDNEGHESYKLEESKVLKYEKTI